MFKKMKYLIGLTAVLLALAVNFLFSEKVYAADPIADCGSNLGTDYSESAHIIEIRVKDNTKPEEENKMFNYGELGTPWWSYRDNIYKIIIDNNVYNIGEYAFEDLSKVTTIYIPATVKSIDKCAFKKCNSLTTVYYGGTEEELKILKANTDVFESGNNSFLNAEFICMDKGNITINLTEDNDGKQFLTTDEFRTFENTVEALCSGGYISKEDKSVTYYNIDPTFGLDNDFSLFFNGGDKGGYVNLSDTSDMVNRYSPYIINGYRMMDPPTGKQVYDYCVSNGLPDNKCFYSSIKVLFNNPDYNTVIIDLRNGDNHFSDPVASYLMISFDAFTSDYEYYYGSPLVGYTDTIYADRDIDYDNDGNYDINIKYDGTNLTVSKLSGAKSNKDISIRTDTKYKEYISYHESPFYSEVSIRVKDKVYKVDEKPATCEADGQEAYYQSYDNTNMYSDASADNKIEAPVVIPKLGHDWSEWKTVKEATVDQEGLEERVCKRNSSHKETRAIPKLTPSPSPTPALPVEPTVEPTPSTSPEDRAKQMGKDGTAFSKGASDVAAEAAITSYSSEKDPKGTAFGLLQAKASKVTKNSIKLAWNKSSEAKSYVIYGNKCGTKNKYEKLITVTGSSYTAKKVAGNKVKKGTYYKFLIVALDKDGNVISTSKTIHAATIGGKVGNDKKVTTKAKKNKVSLKAGKTFKLKAKTKAASKKLKVKKHRAVAYESSDTSVATVSSKGVIKAVGKGTCEVYAYAQNGVSAKIKVTVK